MFFFNLEKESGNVFVDTLGRGTELFEGCPAAIQRAQFCFSGGPDKLAVLSSLKVRVMGRAENRYFDFSKLESVVVSNLVWGGVE